MVGRLVEQQDIGIPEESLRKQYLNLSGARHIFHKGRVFFRRDSKAV